MVRITLIVAFAFLAMKVQAATTAPVNTTVIDAETGRHLEGVYVLYFVGAHAGTLTGHGGRGTRLAIAETRTSENGQFAIAGQRINPHPFWLNTQYEYPALIFFKPGYSPTKVSWEWSGGVIIPSLDDVLNWPQHPQPVALKKAEKKQDYYNALNDILLPFGSDEYECAFKRFPYFILALEQETIRIEKEDNVRLSTPLRELLSDEDHPVPQNTLLRECGSPRAFFEQFGALRGAQ